MGTVTLYLRKEFEATWEAFMKVCDREGDSASQKLEKWVSDYMASHGEGNSQTILEYSGKPKTLPLWKTCQKSKQELRDGQFYCCEATLFLTPDICEKRNKNVGCHCVK